MEVGVGAGWFEKEHTQNGFAFAPIRERFDMLEEYVEVLVGSWAALPFDFEGTHFRLRDQLALPAPLQTPHPPLIFGGRGGPRSRAVAARFGDEYNTAFLGVDDSAALRSRLDEACAAAGRTPSSLPLSLMTLVSPGAGPAEATQRLERMAERFRGPRERCHAGTVEEMTDVLGRYAQAGVTRVYLQYPDRSDFAAIELFGELAARVAPL